MMRKLLLLVAIAPLFVAACGGDEKSVSELTDDEPSAADEADDAASDKEFEDAFVFSLVAESDLGYTEEQARCAARDVIGAIGTERLEEAGLTPELLTSESSAGTDLTDEEARTFVDALFDCGDLAQTFAAEFTSDDDTFPPEAATCFADALVADDFFRDVLATAVQEGGDFDIDLSSETATRMTDLIMGCVDFGELIVSEIERAGAVLTIGERDCLRQGFNSSDDLRRVLADAMAAGEDAPLSDAEIESVFRAVAITCGIPLNP